MTQFPETRESLIIQVKDPDNRVAWEQFVAIYRPVIVRTAAKRGMQAADAQDLAQQVLLAVASAIGDWEKRDESTRFRHWLARVTRNAIVNALTRGAKDRAAGGSSVQELLARHRQPDPETESLINWEYRRQVYP
ncbi:sigma-70 family RNA polymerase sigma factor [Stieleria sp. ICT_E10.1]|uniref:RNA polymerase sigma factor n=1 Tax=Stieleria sedimenti TaxID=2976331 RepID=UPI00217F893E|nr:sigma-70 family RNA polymerase sigma factor [Stieleria sedimenti]MCS7468746.1 sigma-70 family RNA polymerase sigma factor [Stieleria sedimenti]